MLATFEAFARRLTSEMKESIGKIPPPPAFESLTPPPPRRQWWPVVLTALLRGRARCGARLPGVAGERVQRVARARARRLEGRGRTGEGGGDDRGRRGQRHRCEQRTAGGPSAGGGIGGPAAGPIATEYVPYGEAPLAGSRLERLRALASMLETQQFKGRIRVESYVGDFCLGGNAERGLRRRLTSTCQRPSATSSAIPSTTRCRWRSASRSTSPISSRRCAAAPVATSRSKSSTAGAASPSRIPSRTRRPRPAAGTRSRPRTIASNSTSCPPHERGAAGHLRRHGIHGRTDRARSGSPWTPARAGRPQRGDGCRTGAGTRLRVPHRVARRSRRARSRAARRYRDAALRRSVFGHVGADGCSVPAAAQSLPRHHRRNRRARSRARARRRCPAGRASCCARPRASTSCRPIASRRVSSRNCRTRRTWRWDLRRPAGRAAARSRPASRTCRAVAASAAQGASRRWPTHFASATSISATARARR